MSAEKLDKSKPGARSKYDWDGLRAEWMAAGSPPKAAFLSDKGHNPAAGSTRRATADWGQSVVRAANKERAQLRREREVRTATGIKDAEPAEVAEAAAREPGTLEAEVNATSEEPVDAKPDGGGISWKAIAQFRRKQAMEDWRTADFLRSHLKSILKKSLKLETDPETGEGRLVSQLKPHEVRQLAQTATEVQRMQRLALGLSTENLGIDPPDTDSGSHIEKNVTPKEDEQPIPTFQVEMSIGGKFMRPRPRRIR